MESRRLALPALPNCREVVIDGNSIRIASGAAGRANLTA
jgi:hypothetical protein